MLIRSRNSEERPDRFRALRQWLNVVFMIGAIVGMVMYFYGDRSVATVIIFSAMALKFVECVLRLVR